MIECYFKWCQHHNKDEPFCTMDSCVADENALNAFGKLRRIEELGWTDGKRAIDILYDIKECLHDV